MDRMQIRKVFDAIGSVLSVIHVLDAAQTRENIKIAFDEGAHGVLLINHDFPKEALLPILGVIREECPEAWIGVNFLAVTGLDAFPILAHLNQTSVTLNAYWADNACIDEYAPEDRQTEVDAIDKARSASGWRGLYFGGTAFKAQRPVKPKFFDVVARIAARHIDVVTTSGPGTGIAADMPKITAFRRAAKDRALAVASGITPENATCYAPYVDDDFYNINPERLKSLLKICRNFTEIREDVI